jgi:hypothetical protein
MLQAIPKGQGELRRRIRTERKADTREDAREEEENRILR